MRRWNPAQEKRARWSRRWNASLPQPRLSPPRPLGQLQRLQLGARASSASSSASRPPVGGEQQSTLELTNWTKRPEKRLSQISQEILRKASPFLQLCELKKS